MLFPHSQAQLPTVLCRIIVWREELQTLLCLLLLGLTSSVSSPLLHRQSEYLVAQPPYFEISFSIIIIANFFIICKFFNRMPCRILTYISALWRNDLRYTNVTLLKEPVEVFETSSSAWKADIISTIRYRLMFSHIFYIYYRKNF